MTLSYKYENTDLQQFWRSSIVRKQIQSLLNNVTAGATSLVVFWLLTFAENLDGGKPTDLQRNDYQTRNQGLQF